jgi:hypothetical protein
MALLFSRWTAHHGRGLPAYDDHGSEHDSIISTSRSAERSAQTRAEI